MNELEAWGVECEELVHLKHTDVGVGGEDDVESQPTCGSDMEPQHEVPEPVSLLHTQCMWDRLNALPCVRQINVDDCDSTTTTRYLAARYVQTTQLADVQAQPPVPLQYLEHVADAVCGMCTDSLCDHFGRSETQLGQDRIPTLSDTWGRAPYPMQLAPSFGYMRCEYGRDRNQQVVLLPETVVFVALEMQDHLSGRVHVSADSIRNTGATSNMREGAGDRGATVSMFRLGQHPYGRTEWSSAQVPLAHVMRALWPPGRETSSDEQITPVLPLCWPERMCEVFAQLYCALDFVGGNAESQCTHLQRATNDAEQMYDVVTRQLGDELCTVTTLAVPIGLPPHLQDSRLYFVRLNSGHSLLLCYNCELNFTLPLYLPEVSGKDRLVPTDLHHNWPTRTQQRDPGWYRHNLRSLQAFDTDGKCNAPSALLEQEPAHWLVQMCSFFIHRPRGNFPLNKLPAITQEVVCAIEAANRADAPPLSSKRKLSAFKTKVMLEAEEILSVRGIYMGKDISTNQDSLNALFAAPFVATVARSDCVELTGFVVHVDEEQRRRRKRPRLITGTHSFMEAHNTPATRALEKMAFAKLVFETLYQHQAYGSLAPATALW